MRNAGSDWREMGMGKDELYNSYNQCNICYDYHDHMGTPEIFLHFGFVEPMPQRWLFDFARVKFDLNWKDGDETSEEVVVNFLVPLSEKGKHLLQEELTRLKSFAAMHRNTSYEEYENMTKYEMGVTLAILQCIA